jgi:PAS domain S-box-containing protein
MAVAIPWHRRLEAHVLAGVTTIIGVSLAALTVVTGEVVARHTMSRASGDLAAAQAAFTHLVATQSELVAAQTRLITGLPVFRAHMTDSRLLADVATIEAMAEMYREELEAAFTIVSDSRGRWLASPGLPVNASRERLEALVKATAAGRKQREILALQGHLFIVVTEPATFADEVLGTLTTGYALDNVLAYELARTTGRDVALIAGTAISGSSLSPAPRARLADLLQLDAGPFATTGTISVTQLGSEEYVAATFPLTSNANLPTPGRLVLLESWAPTQAFIDQIQWRLLWTGALVFALGIGASLLLSRRMSRPLREIAEAAGEIAQGHWDRRLEPAGSAESVAMATAFNDMTVSLSHWHDQARQRAEQLQASFERFRAVTLSVHDAIVSTDGNGAIIFWHPRAEALFGFAEEEAIGRRFASLLAPELHDRYASAVQNITRDSDDAPDAATIDGEGLRNDGARFPLELSLASWRSGDQTCLTAVIRDVTERRRGEEELRLRDQQLREAQKMDAIGRLASGIAHDFNNSLMVIQGHAEMLSLGLPESDPRRKKVDVIVQSAVGAAAITRRLLTFGRKQESDLRVVDPREQVTSVQKVLGRLLGDNIKVISEAQGTPGHIRIDPDQLDQVIMNLAINARDAMPGGGELRFSVGNTVFKDPAVCDRLGVAPGEYVTIAVSDTGCGMDPETAARIFEAFFTTKEAGRGTGLGLAIVQGIITQALGCIEVDTEPGRGTTFFLHLPRVDAKNEPVRAVPQPTTLERGTETILIAEDKPLVRRILKTALENAGYRVLEAVDGEQAVEVARRHSGRIDLLLTDVVMPGAGGFALYQALKAVRPSTDVIFMTGHPPGAEARAEVDRSGAVCLQKPFSFDVLSRAMRAVIDAARAA